MAQRPDLRGDAALRMERIVAGYAAVLVEAHDLAEIGLHVLRRRELLAIAGSDPQLAIRPEGETLAEVALSRHLGYLSPDDREILEFAAAAVTEDQPGARHGGAAVASITGFGVTQVHNGVLRVTGMQDHVAEAALAAIGHLGQAGDVT